jgi:hypothetical protein
MADPQNGWNVHARRWAITVLAVWLFAAVANELIINQPLYRKAATIRLGQTQKEVVAILGWPEYSLGPSTGPGPPGPVFEKFFYGPFQTWWDNTIFYPNQKWLSRGQYGIGFGEDGYPLVIHFDANLRVTRIRYGRTVVE